MIVLTTKMFFFLLSETPRYLTFACCRSPSAAHVLSALHIIMWEGTAASHKAAPLGKKSMKKNKIWSASEGAPPYLSETLEAGFQASDVLYSGVISGFR